MQPPGTLTEADSASRRELLRPQLVRLRQQTIDHPRANEARTVLCGQRSLRVSALEWASVIQAFKDVGTGRNCCHLLAESIALEMRSAERGPSADDYAIGLAIARDLSVARRGLLQARSTDRAELVAEATTRLELLLRYLKSELSATDMQRAEIQSELLKQERGSLLAVRAATLTAPKAGAPAVGPSARQKAGARALANNPAAAYSVPRTWRRWGVVALCAALALLLANTMLGGKAPRRLSREDFRDQTTLARVKSKAGTLDVTLKASGWKQLQPGERRELLARVTQKAEDSGYDQANFSSEDGTSLAHWTAGRDAEIY